MPVGIGTPQVDGLANGDPNWGPKVKGDIDALNGQFALAAINTYRPANASARGSLTTMRAGDIAVQLDTGVTYRFNGSAWRAWESDWLTWTPVTTNFVLDTSSWITQYRFVAGSVRVRVVGTILTASATSFVMSVPVTSDPTFNLPTGRVKFKSADGAQVIDLNTIDYNGTVVMFGYETQVNPQKTLYISSTQGPVAGWQFSTEFEYDPA